MLCVIYAYACIVVFLHTQLAAQLRLGLTRLLNGSSGYKLGPPNLYIHTYIHGMTWHTTHTPYTPRHRSGKPCSWDVVSVTRRSSGVAPRACVRVYARVLVPPNLYIHTYM